MNIEEKCRNLLNEEKYDECRKVIEIEMAKMPDSPIPQNLLGLLEERRFDKEKAIRHYRACLLYTSPSPRDSPESRMPSSA